MAVTYTLRLTGIRVAQDGLRRLRDMPGNLLPLMKSIAALMESHAVEAFDTETAPDGRRWKPSIRAQASGGQTLTDTARLRRSITSAATPRSASTGTNLVYAGIHQQGGVIKAKTSKGLLFRIGDVWIRKATVTIPARPFIGPSKDLQDDVTDMVMGAIRRAADGTAGAAAP